MTPPDLIARLEAAPEGSQELSDEVLLACGWKHITTGDPREDEWVSPDGTEHFDYWMDPHWRGAAEPIPRRPDPTRSLDDAVALVPEGWAWAVHSMFAQQVTNHEHERPHAVLWKPNGEPMPVGYAATPALALCIAILKARSS